MVPDSESESRNCAIISRAGARRCQIALDDRMMISGSVVVINRIAALGNCLVYPSVYLAIRRGDAPPSQVQRIIRADGGVGGEWR